MPVKLLRPHMRLVLATIVAIIAPGLACSRSVFPGESPTWQGPGSSASRLNPSPTPFSFLPPTLAPPFTQEGIVTFINVNFFIPCCLNF
jgi:hypothetical protein